jgi:hypothetical protein
MFAKLTSTKLTSNRVSRQSCIGLRGVPMLLAHANDNHVTRHSSAGAAGRPVLTCRWFPSAKGGLECRWFLADGEATRLEDRLDESGEAACVQRPVAVGGRHLALVKG